MGTQHEKTRRTGARERGGVERRRGVRVHALCAAVSSLILLLGWLAPAMAASASSTPVPAIRATVAPDMQYGKTNTGSVNARTEPSTKAAKVTTLRKGSVFPILGSTIVGKQPWYQVELDGSTAYIRGDLVDLIEEADALALMASQQANAVRVSSGSSGSGSSAGASQGGMVWLSANGSKYHSRNNCGNMNPDKAEKVPLEEAQRRGKSRCKKCH